MFKFWQFAKYGEFFVQYKSYFSEFFMFFLLSKEKYPRYSRFLRDIKKTSLLHISPQLKENYCPNVYRKWMKIETLSGFPRYHGFGLHCVINSYDCCGRNAENVFRDPSKLIPLSMESITLEIYIYFHIHLFTAGNFSNL